MRTSCATRTLRPDLDIPNISKLKTAWSFFFASFMTTSSASYVGRIDAAIEDEAADEEDDRRADSKASVDSVTDISLFALDWILYDVNMESTFMTLSIKIEVHAVGEMASGFNSRPDLNATLVRVIVADDVHLAFGELDDTCFLQLFYCLYDT